MSDFQDKVNQWLEDCFGVHFADHLPIRIQRFFEECVEQIHALKVPEEILHDIVEWVYKTKERGGISGEAGQVQVAHAALCYALGIDAHALGLKELERINDPELMAKIRDKHALKPIFKARPLYPHAVTENNGVIEHRATFVSQPTPNTCVHACLSMVTGVPAYDLIERFGDRPLGIKESRTVLIENGLFPIDKTVEDVFEYAGVYLATVPSLNIKAGTHQIVIVNNGDSTPPLLLDPNTGKKDVEWYPADILDPRANHDISIRLFEILYLCPRTLSAMDASRVRLPAKKET